MKILIISGSPIMGGAEQVARGLVRGLANAGLQIIYVCITPEKIYKKNVTQYILYNKKFEKNFYKNIKFFSYSLAYFFNTRYVINHINLIINKEKPDIINIHNIKQAFWAPELINFCAKKNPLIWTLHDMSSFTGRCIHAQSCLKFITGCDELCENLHIPIIIPRSLTKKRWTLQKRLLENNRDIIGVTPSNWLAQQALKSIWKKNKIHIINNGINIHNFYPIEKKKAKEILGLPSELFIFLTIAFDLNDPLKGGTLLFEALNLLNRNDFLLITVGNQKGLNKRHSNYPIYNLGYLDTKKLVVAYSAADLFIYPSLAESFGLVILEANACGTPVIAYSHTALNEIIIDGVNGWLVPNITSQALANKVSWVLNSGELSNSDINKRCIKHIHEKYLIEYQIKKYQNLFNNIILHF